MSFYDDASWLLIPSGIKEDVVFAQKPTSGLGDLTFTRASDATYTDSTGVVRRSPYNLFTQSVWTGGGVNIAPTGWSQSQTTGNFEPQTAINGSVPYRFYGTAGRRFLFQSLNVVSGQEFRISIFVNSVAVSTTLSGMFQVTGVTLANFKYYVNNVEVLDSTLITANTRIELSFTVTSTGSATLRVGGGSAGAATYDYVISQPQLVEGASALDYFPTTNRQDVPRIDFRNADGTLSSCGRLLLEPQRTNSIRNSSMVGAVAGSPGTLPTNYSVSASGLTRTVVGIGTENGLQYVDLRFNGTSTTTFFEVFPETTTQIAAANGQTWTSSFYIKTTSMPTPPNSYALNIIERTSAGVYVANGTQSITIDSTLKRYNQTRTLSGGATVGVVLSSIVFNLTNGATYDFTIRIAAPQMELGAYATTWVPTTTAAVTRLADDAIKEGISSLIGQTEGTIFADIRYEVAQQARMAITDGTTNNWIFFAFPETGTTSRIYIRSSNVVNVDQSFSSLFTANQTYKIALAYKTGNWAFYVNGTQVASGTNSISFNGTFDRIFLNGGSSTIGGVAVYAKYNQAVLFPTRLTNAQLAQMTTL